MKIYLASVFHNGFEMHGREVARMNDREKHARASVTDILDSYHYINNERDVRNIRREGIKIFLDSGAYSAMTQGTSIDIAAYTAFIKEHTDIIEVASVLDVVGDPFATINNQSWLEEHGVHALPCFHYNENENYLEWYVNRYPYITLGGMVPVSNSQLVVWLDRIWERYLCDSSGQARVKVHGFGLTSIPLMERYPWYSVDSSSWIQIAAAGAILIPGIGNVFVSNNSTQRYNTNAMHIDCLPPVQRHSVQDVIDRSGFSIKRLQQSYVPRRAFNCEAFRYLADKLTREAKPFRRIQPELFT